MRERRAVHLIAAAALTAAAAGSCELGTPDPAAIRIAVTTADDVPPFRTVRVEMTLDAGIGVWERGLAGPGTVTVVPSSEWTGTLRAWALGGAEGGTEVVGFGVATGDRGATSAAVTLERAEDGDDDWIPDAADVCPDRYDPRQGDGDRDGIGNVCDLCPATADPDQGDADGDGAGDACDPAVCGNGFVERGEECDEGNTGAGDGCSSACTREACGNGALDSGEECDDGNTGGGGSCSAACRSVPVPIAQAGVRVEAPSLAVLADGTILAGWTVTRDAMTPDRDVVFATIDPISGALVATASPWTSPDARIVSLHPGAAAASPLALWVYAPTGPEVHYRLVGSRVPRSLSGFVAPATVTDDGVLRAWGPPGGPPAAVAYHALAADSVAVVRWVDAGAWPPAEDGQLSDAYSNVDWLGGALRTSGGWLVAWTGTRSGGASSRTALWARRFAGDRAAIDGADLWLGDVGSVDAAWVVYEPVSDRYLVGVDAAEVHPGGVAWFGLDALSASPPPDAAVTGAELPDGAAVVAAGDGTLLAYVFDAPGGACVVSTTHLDGEGRAAAGGGVVVLDEPGEALACAGTLALVEDGRAFVLWGRAEAGDLLSATTAWRFLPSIADLVDPP